MVTVEKTEQQTQKTANKIESKMNNNSTRDNNQESESKNWVHSLLINSSTLWRNSSRTIDNLLEDYGVYEILDYIATQLSRHPYLAFGLSICVISCALPFIIFMIFAIATVIMTFTGFVIIEGTLITIASALLFGFLGAVVLFFLFFGFGILAAYFGLMQIYELIDYPGRRDAVMQYFTNSRRSQN